MGKVSKLVYHFIFVVALFLVAAIIALPETWRWEIGGQEFYFDKSSLTGELWGLNYDFNQPLKQGLDLAGGVQIVLEAEMAEVAEGDRRTALESSVEVVRRRIDAYGVNEPVIQTAIDGDSYRIIVELAGVSEMDEALALIGTTAEMEFRLQEASVGAEVAGRAAALGAEASAEALLEEYLVYLDSFQATELTGAMLRRATATYNQQTGQPVVSLEFNDQGREVFAAITRENQGDVLGIFIDGEPVTTPMINDPIVDGMAIISGQFDAQSSQELAIQLNSGALPVSLEILQQKQVGASLGAESVESSLFAGIVGLFLVGLFMILIYGKKGVIAVVGLMIYTVLIIALYKILGITLTLPGVAALVISIGMALDANILIFARLNEELRSGKSLNQARELAFGRAWDSIRDANTITIAIAVILINPLNFSFLNTSGMIRGFGITLLLGVVTGLFTGVYVSRVLMRIFLRERNPGEGKKEKKQKGGK